MADQKECLTTLLTFYGTMNDKDRSDRQWNDQPGTFTADRPPCTSDSCPFTLNSSHTAALVHAIQYILGRNTLEKV